MKAKGTDLTHVTRGMRMGTPYKRALKCDIDHRTPREFVVGELYFMLWYPDQENQAEQNGLFLVPDSVVFIGKNVDGNEDKDTWFFQDTKSYCAYGAYPNNADAGLGPDEYYGQLYALNEVDLYQIVDCPGLIEALSQCIARRQRSRRSD